ncbi:MAG TPA: hypothetical protein VFW44_05990 [Bryobacteraceae bacterium]|nr:hypothetical protein [Bryobacteraceae bacterium]
MKILLCSTLFAALVGLPLAAQSSKSNYTPPKTAWGDPDIQGQWPATARIPMQRPTNLGTRSVLTDAELSQREEQFKKQASEDGEQVASGATAGSVTINPPSYWQERGQPDRQASLVVDPPDGRVPPLTPEGQAAVHALRGGLGPGSHFPDKVDSWEDFDIYSRCITRGVVSSMLPTLYNFGNEILQAPGYVIIRNEMIHEARVIPIDKPGQHHPHVGKAIETYMGDSRGHWEGNTLVIETSNLKPQPGAGGGLFTDAAVLTERFTRTSPTALNYDMTVNDPKTWTRPWTIHMPFKLDPSYKIYEYACHEGNYMMLDALSGARDLEKKGESTKVTPGR